MHLDSPKPLPTEYSDILRDILSDRILKNKNYSLRAFARDLDLNPGFLSDVLMKKSNLSLKKSEVITKKLFSNQEDQNFFNKLVEISNLKGEEKTKAGNQVYNFDSSYIAISPTAYSSISQWHSMAFLELMCTCNFKYDLNWIADKLAIAPVQVEEIIKSLLANNLIVLENNQLVKQYDYLALPNGNKSHSAKDFHKDVLDKGARAIDEQVSEIRNFSAAFLHIDSNDIPEISERIKIFRRELAREFESKSTADSVYMLAAQLFRVDQEGSVKH